MSLFNLLYIDPAAVSVILSSVTVIVLGVGASLIIWWRKFKNKVNKTFNIDPNKGKEIEDDLVITDDTTDTAETPATTEEVAQVETVEETTATQEEIKE